MIFYPFLLKWSLFRKIDHFWGVTFCLSTKAQVIISSLNMNGWRNWARWNCIPNPQQNFRIQIWTLEVISCEFPPKTNTNLGGWCSTPHEFLLISSSFRICWFQMLVQKNYCSSWCECVYSSSCFLHNDVPNQKPWAHPTELLKLGHISDSSSDVSEAWWPQAALAPKANISGTAARGLEDLPTPFWLKKYISSGCLNQPIWKICSSNWKSSPKYWWK